LKHKYEFSHGIDFYGSYLGIQEKYKIDITDDYEYLLDSDFFLSKKQILYELDSEELLPISGSEKKPKLIFGDILETNPLDSDVLEMLMMNDVESSELMMMMMEILPSL
jgi:hypothetical protein